MSRRFDISVVGLYILDILGRPVTAIPDGGNVEDVKPDDGDVEAPAHPCTLAMYCT